MQAHARFDCAWCHSKDWLSAVMYTTGEAHQLPQCAPEISLEVGRRNPVQLLQCAKRVVASSHHFEVFGRLLPGADHTTVTLSGLWLSDIQGSGQCTCVVHLMASTALTGYES